MKSLLVVGNVFVAVLVGFCLLLVIFYQVRLRQLRNLQPIVAKAQTYQNLVNSLANEALEYSQHNPAIDPILTPVGVKPSSGKAATPASNKPGTK